MTSYIDRTEIMAEIGKLIFQAVYIFVILASERKKKVAKGWTLILLLYYAELAERNYYVKNSNLAQGPSK